MIILFDVKGSVVLNRIRHSLHMEGHLKLPHRAGNFRIDNRPFNPNIHCGNF